MGAGTSEINLPIAKLVGHTQKITSLVFNSDDSLIATASADRTINIYAPEVPASTSGLRKISSNAADGHARSGSVVSADGARMLMLRGDRLVELWTEHDLESKFASHLGFVSVVAIHPKGHVAASAGGDCTIALYDCQARQEVLTIPVASGTTTTEVLGLAFSPTEPIIASCGTDHAVSLFSYQSSAAKAWEAMLLLKLQGHQRWIKRLAFSADGAALASGAFENQILLWRRQGATWDAQTVGKAPLLLPTWSTPAVYCLAFDKHGKYVASGSEAGDVVVHTLTDTAQLYGVKQPRHGMLWHDQLFNSTVVDLAIHGELLLAGALHEKAVRVHKAENGHALAVYNVASFEPLACLNLVLPSATDLARLYAMTSSGQLMKFKMRNLGAEDLQSVDSFSENVIHLERKLRLPYEKDVSVPDPEVWHRFAAREFTSDAERDETTIVGREARSASKGSSWNISENRQDAAKDPNHATTHERVVAYPRSARADGLSCTFEQLLPPGKYDVAWRVKPIRGGVPSDNSIRTIMFEAKVGNNKVAAMHQYEWSTEQQMARPWQAGWSTLYTGQLTVVDKPRPVLLSWYTLPPGEHGPMTSGIDSVDSIMIRNVTALPTDALNLIGAQEGAAAADGRFRKGEKVFINLVAGVWCPALVFDDEAEGASTVRVVPMEEKKESEQDTSKPVVPKEKLKRTQLNIAWGAQAKAKEEASPEQVQRQARFFPDLT